MGIREVMVVVGGKSVGDVVELLSGRIGVRARPDLPLPARLAGHRPRHRAGARFRGDDAFCVVLGDNILRGRPWPTTPPRLRHRALGRRHAALPGAGPGALRRGRVRRGRPGRRLRGEAGAAQEQPDPHRRLFPAARRVRRHRATSRRPAGASSRSPTCSTTTSRAVACSPVSTTGTGRTPAPFHRCSGRPPWRPTTTPPGDWHRRSTGP